MIHPCRHCGTGLPCSWAPGEDHWVVRECSVCGYVNVIEETWFALGLADRVGGRASAREMASIQRTSNDPKEGVAAVIQTARVLVRALREMVRAEPEVARRALLPAVNRREKTIRKRIAAPAGYGVDSEADIFSRVVDLLYLSLAAEGALDAAAIRHPNSKGVASFLSKFEHAASDLAVLAMFARSIRRGELVPALRSGVLGLAKGPRHAMAAEWAFNRRKLALRQKGESRREIFPEPAVQAQELFLGFSARDLLEWSRDGFAALRGEAGMVPVRDAILFDLARLDERFQRILAATTLRLEVVLEFERPFFFGLGTRLRAPRSVDDALLWAASVNWSYYYPFLALPDSGSGRPWVVTNQGTVVTFLANLHAQKNGLLDRIVEASRETGLKEVDRIRALRVESNLKLEKEAVELGARAGWRSLHLDNLGGESLPCGDIDGLFARRLETGEVVVVLAEVKDADYMPHKDDLFDELHERQVREALDQLDRKAEWLRDGWKEGVGRDLFGSEFGPEAKGTLLRVLVTRVAPPLYLITTAESVTIDHLERYLFGLRNGLPDWLIGRRRSTLPL